MFIIPVMCSFVLHRYYIVLLNINQVKVLSQKTQPKQFLMDLVFSKNKISFFKASALRREAVASCTCSRSKVLFLFMLILSFCVPSFIGEVQASPSTWSIETVEDPPLADVGQYTSIARSRARNRICS